MSFNEHVAAACRAAQSDVDAMNAQFVTTIFGRPVTRGELGVTFDRVADRDNWKNPICKTVVAATEAERQQIAEAIEFFTGSKATFERYGNLVDGTFLVRAAGYYATIGA